MLQDIVAVEARDNYQLFIRFEDGAEGIIDISKLIKFTGVFEPLRNQEYFANVELNHEVGTVQWQSGTDLDPDVLYALITNQPIPNYQLSHSA